MLAKQRDRRLKDAEMVKALRMRETEALYSFEVQAAEDEYAVSVTCHKATRVTCIGKGEKAAIKQKLLAQVEETIKKLENLKNGAPAAENQTFTRTLRSKTKGDSANGGFEALEFEKQSRSRKNNDGIGINFFMKQDDIARDLQEIQSSWQAAAENFTRRSGRFTP